jgi:hypothetical protein
MVPKEGGSRNACYAAWEDDEYSREPAFCSSSAPFGNPFYDENAVEWGVIPTSVTISAPQIDSPEASPPSLDSPLHDAAVQNNGVVYAGEVLGLALDYYYYFGPFDTADIYGYLYYSTYEDGTTTFPGVTIVNQTDSNYYLDGAVFTYIDGTVSNPYQYSGPFEYQAFVTDEFSSNSGRVDHIPLPGNYVHSPHNITISVELIFWNWDRTQIPMRFTLTFP